MIVSTFFGHFSITISNIVFLISIHIIDQVLLELVEHQVINLLDTLQQHLQVLIGLYVQNLHVEVELLRLQDHRQDQMHVLSFALLLYYKLFLF